MSIGDFTGGEQGPLNYRSNPALSARRLAWFLTHWLGEIHHMLAHQGDAASEDEDGQDALQVHATRRTTTKDGWRVCNREPCVNARRVLAETGTWRLVQFAPRLGKRSPGRPRKHQQAPSCATVPPCDTHGA